jgi:hypothetical protein
MKNECLRQRKKELDEERELVKSLEKEKEEL